MENISPWAFVYAYCLEQDPTVTVQDMFGNVRLTARRAAGKAVEYEFSIWKDTFKVPRPKVELLSQLPLADKSLEKLQTVEGDIECSNACVNPCYATLIKLLTTHFPETYPTTRAASAFIKASHAELHPTSE